MIRVLHIVSKMDMGGIESYLMNIYRNIDRNKVQFDFVVNTEEKGYFDDEISALGGEVFCVCTKRDSFIKNYKQIKKIVKYNRYKVVHRHGSNSHMALDLLAAKYGGAKCRIAHSHSNRATGFKPAHIMLKFLLKRVATDFFACSNDAGKHLFGKSNFIIKKNAIDINKFQYKSKLRNEVRSTLGIEEDELVIGNVGRLHREKNHLTLIEIFSEFHKEHPDSRLLLIGEGQERINIEEKIKKLNLSENVLLLGLRDDISEIMQAMDVFLFPSLNEGLGIVLIEAQASGLPCLASLDVIPQEVKITELVQFISLDNTPKHWANEMVSKIDSSRNRYSYGKELENSAYNIKRSSSELQQFYLNV